MEGLLHEGDSYSDWLASNLAQHILNCVWVQCIGLVAKTETCGRSYNDRLHAITTLSPVREHRLAPFPHEKDTSSNFLKPMSHISHISIASRE